MNQQFQADLKKIEFLLEQVKEQGLNYLNSLSERPASVKMQKQNE